MERKWGWWLTPGTSSRRTVSLCLSFVEPVCDKRVPLKTWNHVVLHCDSYCMDGQHSFAVCCS
jgi:hypothetical protein